MLMMRAKLRVTCIATFAVLVACFDSSQRTDAFSSIGSRANRPARSVDLRYPDDTIYFSNSQIARSSFGDFSSQLQDSSEPPFHNARAINGAFALRLFIWRSFHDDLLIRIEGNRKSCTVHSAHFTKPEIDWSIRDSIGAPNALRIVRPSNFVRHNSEVATARNCDDVKRAFDLANELNQRIPPDAAGVDGSIWIFESLDESGHRAFARLTPSGELQRAGTMAIRLSKVLSASGPIY